MVGKGVNYKKRRPTSVRHSFCHDCLDMKLQTEQVLDFVSFLKEQAYMRRSVILVLLVRNYERSSWKLAWDRSAVISFGSVCLSGLRRRICLDLLSITFLVGKEIQGQDQLWSVSAMSSSWFVW